MKRGTILALVGLLMLAGCAFRDAGNLDSRVTQECPRPETFLTNDPWEVIAGRLGDELILCEARRQAAVNAYDALRNVR